MSKENKIYLIGNKKIVLDKNAGFCFGVKRACEKAFAIEEKREKRVFSLGPIIHNENVTKKLEENGVIEIDCLDSVLPQDLVILRSHGEGEATYRKLTEKEAEIIDCTCPFVRKIQELAKEYSEKGYSIIIAGDPNHPEVKSILGWCDGKGYGANEQKTVDNIPVYDKICLVSQTTLTEKMWESVKKSVQDRFPNPVIINTICSATSDRQSSAAELAKTSDIMIVVGSENSSNTNKLFQICKENCEEAVLVTGKGQLKPGILKDKNSIGVTAGASTPDWIIEEVILEMEEKLGMEEKMTEKNEKIVAEKPEEVMTEEKNEVVTEEKKEVMTEEKEEVVAEEKEEIVEEEIIEDQASLMEAYMKTLHTGEIVTGSVIQVDEDAVMVNIGYKADGIVKREEFSWDNSLDLRTLIKVGDPIEVSVLSINDGDGNVVLSKKAVDAEKNWHKIDDAYVNRFPVDGTIRQVVKGGVIADVYGIRAFIPASHLDLRFTEDLNKFVNMEFKGYILEFIREKKKVVVSRKEFLQEERAKVEDKVWETIKEGQKLTGEVKRLADFGAFVDIGGLDGLVHISEISWSRIKHPSEVLKVGDKIEVIILSLDREKKKVSLGYKSLVPAPWTQISEKFNVGDIIDVKVLRMTDFGAFVEIIPGVDGLVHVSQIANKRIGKPSEILSLGQIVKAKIIDIKIDEKKISLSIRATLPEEPIEVVDEVKEENAVVKVEEEKTAVVEIREEEKAVVEVKEEKEKPAPAKVKKEKKAVVVEEEKVDVAKAEEKALLEILEEKAEVECK